MKFHWMHVYEEDSLKNLKIISKTADDSGYESILFVYHSKLSDFWIKCANIIDVNQKIKYMLAIRTYSVSPEYFFMKYKAFEEICQNRLMFNIVSGDLQKTENSIEDLAFPENFLNTSEKRIEYTGVWIEKLKKIFNRENIKCPEFVMSGVSDLTLKNANSFANYNLSMLSNFLDSPKRYIESAKNTMVCLAITVRDSFEEAENVVDNIENKHQKLWTIYGSENDIINKIKELKKIGVTDLMIRVHSNDKETYRVHDLVKKISKGDYL